MGIPKHIIQTGKSAVLDLMEQATTANVTLLNPGFKRMFFDDAAVGRFMEKEFPRHLPVFNGFRFPIQRYDFFRYLAVFRHGGFYLDMDVFLARGLKDLLEKNCVFPFEELTINRHLRGHHGMDWEIGNFAFGAEAGHPFLEAVIENCVRAQKDPEWVKPMLKDLPRLFHSEFIVLNTTGPGLLSRTLAEHPSLASEVTVLFPPDVCDSRYWHRFGDYGVHLMQGSWRVRGSYIRRRLGNLWESWASRRALVESRREGPRRRYPANPAPTKPLLHVPA